MFTDKIGRLTTPDHVVDHDWSVGVNRLRSYIWVSKVFISHGEHLGGGAGS